MLTAVTSPGASPDIRQYHYENTTATNAYSLLTGISNNGIRYSRYSYYNDRRVSESALEGGEVSDKFVYGTGQTTLTDAKGQATTYGFALVAGDNKIVSVSRGETSTCPSAAARTAYDSNGYPDYKVDWKGNMTDYSYDTSGQMLKETTAAGTVDAATVAHSWTDGKIMQSHYINAVNMPYLRVTYTYDYRDNLASETWADLGTGAIRKTTYSYLYGSASGTFSSVGVTRHLPSGSATTTSNYDMAGNLVSRTNPLNQTETWSSYNGLGQVGTYTDINGIATDLVYEQNGNLKTATKKLPAGHQVTSYTYNHAGQPPVSG